MPAQPSDPKRRLPSSGHAVSTPETCWRFGTFVVWANQRRIERLSQAIRVGPRTFELLLHLLAHAGELISKDELLSSVWAGVVVEEASVRVHMSLLRKALGEPRDEDGCREWITNVPLRGYRFNGEVIREEVDGPTTGARRSFPAFARLPARLTGLVGRDAEVDDVVAMIASHRLVTIVGPGGIGKTSVAIHAAGRYVIEEAIEVAFVDLSPLISPAHVVGTLARSLAIAADLPDPVQAIIERLATRDLLLLVDNCEHVVDSLAAPITHLLGAAPGLRILATSREALGLAGEYVICLPTLAIPGVEQVTLGQVLQWPSVQLLVERADAAGASAFDESHAPLLARISRQLDGIPLAIELVAARLGVESLSDLVHRFGDHMRVLSIGKRAALERHRTLAATLDWSVARLGEDELRMFRRLSVFRAGFDVESALAVAAADLDPDAALDALISLVRKSLVMFDGHGAATPYRLLVTTRSYAAALLAQCGERPALLHRHAVFMLERMQEAASEWPSMEEHAWGERHAHHLDDLRFALETCLVGRPDAAIAAALVMESMPLWFHVSEVAEYRQRVASTLHLLQQQPSPDRETEAWLRTTLIIALLHADALNPELDSICEQAIAGALELGVPALELQARWGQCTHEMFGGRYAQALRHSATLLDFARTWGDPAALNLAHRVSAMANHFSGRLDLARQHCEAARNLDGSATRTRANMVGVDPEVATKAMLARTLWIQGDTSLALEVAADSVERAEACGQAVSLCAALYGACPVALWTGEIDLADRWIHRMRREAQLKGLVGWRRYADWFMQGLQLGTAHDPQLQILAVGEQLSTYDAPRKEMLVTFCADWVDEAMLARVRDGEDLWSAAEIWRAAGWRSQQRGSPTEAEDFYRRALDTARRQGAKGWERRAALSLAGLLVDQRQPRQALRLLDASCEGESGQDPGQDAALLRAMRDGIRAALSRAAGDKRDAP